MSKEQKERLLNELADIIVVDILYKIGDVPFTLPDDFEEQMSKWKPKKHKKLP